MASMEDVGAPSASRQAGKTARGRSDGHFRHPACVENSDVPPAFGPPTTIYNRYNRWSQRRIWQRIFEKMAAAGPVPDELSIDSRHVKAHRSAAGSKRGSSRKRLAVRAAEERAKSMLWPMIAADRSRLR
jgi:transposase